MALWILPIMAQDSQIRVSGNASGTWEGSVIVEGSALVRKGDTLSIKPGTIVMMRGAQSRLTVQGILYSDGTRESPVVFKHHPHDNLQWDRILFFGSKGSELHYTIISHSVNGAQFINSSVNLQYCLFNLNERTAMVLQNSHVQAYGTVVRGETFTPLRKDDKSSADLENCSIPGMDTPQTAAGEKEKPKESWWKTAAAGIRAETGANFQAFSRSEDSTSDFSQLNMPFILTAPFGDNFKVVMYTALSSMSGSDPDESVTGLTDTRMQGVIFGKNFMLNIGFNLPTGKTGLSEKENELNDAVADENLLFDVKRMGEGTGVNAGAAYAGNFSKTSSYGIGLGFYNRGAYDRLSDTASKYDPGDMVVITLGLDYRISASLLRLDVMGSYFGKELENNEDMFRQGAMVLLKSAWSTEIRKTRLSLSLYDLVRRKNKYSIAGDLYYEPSTTHGNRIGMGADWAVPFGRRLLAQTGLNLRADAKNDYEETSPYFMGRRTIASVKLGASYAVLHKLLVSGEGAFHKGSQGKNFALTGGTDITGYEAGIKLRYGF